MFERYTEQSRRVIFFARYEASQYGSRYIETEHMLLGLMRERPGELAAWFPGDKNVRTAIRDEIEKRITRGESISTSVEVPLSLECRKILALAGDMAETLGHRCIEPEHLLIAMLGTETCLAAQILSARGLKASRVEQVFARGVRQTLARDTSRSIPGVEAPGFRMLKEFLEGLRSQSAGELVRLFATNAQFIDASGQRWTREEIESGGETLFAGYAKKNATYAVEETLIDTGELFVATVLWKNALLASQERGWMHRMTAVLQFDSEKWKIVLLQVTAVQASSSACS